MEKISSKPVRGARDILPAEMRVRDHLEQTIAGIYRAHGFSRIETPALENIDLLLGSDGGDNLKMLFTILKRGDKLVPKDDIDYMRLFLLTLSSFGLFQGIEGMSRSFSTPSANL